MTSPIRIVTPSSKGFPMRRALLATLPALWVLTGCPGAVKPPPPPEPAPEVVSFTASQAVVAEGGAVTLSWETKNATSVELRDTEAGVVSGVDASATSGSVEVVIPGDRLFVLTAKNARGVRESAAVVVQVEQGAQQVIFIAQPEAIRAGEKAVLAWSAAGAESVSLATAAGEAVDIGTQTTSGTVQVAPVTTTSWVLTVDGATYEASVNVSPSVDAVAAAPSPVLPGGDLTLSWKATGASKVTVTGAGRGILYEETDAAKVVDGSFTEQISAEADPASVLSYEIRAEAQDGTFDVASLTVYVGGAPAVVAWEAPDYALQGGTFEVSWTTTGADVVEIFAGTQRVYVSPAGAAASGTATLASPAAETAYVLHARDSRGVVAVGETKTVSPVGIPSVTAFTASPQPGIANGGDAVTLTWNAPNARNVRIVANNNYVVHETSGVSAEMGNITAYPNADVQYVLEADNDIGDSITATADVTVATPAKLTFSPQQAPEGALVSLTGTTVNGGGDVYDLTLAIYNLPGEAFVDISATGVDTNYSGPDTTAAEETLSEPFYMTLFGQTVGGTQISTSINGWFAFGSSSVSTDTPTPFPTTVLEPNTFAPFFDDLYDVTAGEIFYQIDTVGMEKRLIVQWNQVEYDPVAGSELTFQVQLYESGKVVFAYQTLQGITGATPSIGIIDGTESDAVTAPRIPSAGDTYTFFGGGTPPLTVIAANRPVTARQQIGTSSFIQFTAQAPPAIAPDQFRITEVMRNPAAGVVDGQWIEIENLTNGAFDLDGWTIDFNGAPHTITGPTVVPANGYLLLGQSATAGDGLSVGYVYGNTFQIPAGAGTVGLVSAGVAYTTLSLSSGQAAEGHSLQIGAARAGMELKTGLTELVCAASSASSFGSQGQKGTPGAPNTQCPNYLYSGAIAGAFESISATGTPITFGNTNEDVAAVTLTAPVRFGNVEYSTVYVNTNGFLTLEPHTCPSATDCYYTNKSTINSTGLPVGAIAPFWDDLIANTTNSGVYWERKVPGLQPNDGYTIVSWENWDFDGTLSSTTGNLYFQVKFFDNGDIELHLGASTGGSSARVGGSSATTWLEVPEGGAAFEVNTNSSTLPGVDPNTGYRFAAQ